MGSDEPTCGFIAARHPQEITAADPSQTKIRSSPRNGLPQPWPLSPGSKPSSSVSAPSDTFTGPHVTLSACAIFSAPRECSTSLALIRRCSIHQGRGRPPTLSDDRAAR